MKWRKLLKYFPSGITAPFPIVCYSNRCPDGTAPMKPIPKACNNLGQTIIFGAEGPIIMDIR
jgi:hypothetical protein